MKNLLLSLFLFFYLYSSFGQATFTSIVTNGDWSTPSTWSFTGSDADGIPDGDDNVIIEEGTKVTVTSITTSCSTLSNAFSDGAVFSAGELNISSNGNLTITNSTNLIDGSNLNEKFTIRLSSTTSTLTFQGSTVFNTSTNDKIEIVIGALATNAKINFEDDIDLGGTKIIASLPNGIKSKIFFSNSNKSFIPITSSSVLPNIIINTTDTLLISNNLNSAKIKGDFKVYSGVFSNGGYSMSGTKNFTLNTGCTLILEGTSGYPTFTTDSFYSQTHVMYLGTNQSVASKNYSMLTIDGSGTKTLLGTAAVSKSLFLNNGTFNLNNQNFTLQSTSSEHAMLYPQGGTFSNATNFVLERYVQSEGYSILSIPVSVAEIEDLDDDFNLYNMTGATPGGGFSNWFTYNESSLSFDSPTTTNTLLEMGKGYLTYIENGNLTLDVAGFAPLTSSSFNINGYNATGDGFAFVGNPYNAPVGFDADNLTNLGTFGYKVNVTKDGYDPILAAITPTVYLAPWQGIWIQSIGSNGGYTFNSSDIDQNENDNFNARSANEEDPLLKDLITFKLIDNFREDILYIKATGEATDGFDPKYDLEKFNNIPGQANIVAKVEERNLSVNTFAYDSTYKEVFISIFTDFPSTSIKNYVLHVNPSSNFINNNTCYKLLDLVTGATYTIGEEDLTLVFSQNDSVTTPRFKLIYHKPINLNINHLSCYAANDGRIVALNPNNENLTFEWYSNGKLVKQNTTINNDTLENLAAGKYTLTQSGNSSCASIMQSVYAFQPPKINVNYSLSLDTVNFDTQQPTTLSVVQDSSIAVEVELQNGNQFTNPFYLDIFPLQSGTNLIYINSTDGTCNLNDTLSFFAISSASIQHLNTLNTNYAVFAFNKQLTINKLDNIEQQFDIKIVDISGKLIFQRANISGSFSKALEIPDSIYLITITDINGSQSFTVKI